MKFEDLSIKELKDIIVVRDWDILKFIEKESQVKKSKQSDFKHGELNVENPDWSRSVLGSETKAQYVYTTIDECPVLSIATPETRALTSGLVQPDKKFIASRLHFGEARIYDARVATYQLLSTLMNFPETKYFFESPENIGVLDILREAEAYDAFNFLSQLLKANIVGDKIDSGHLGEDNFLDRTVMLYKAKFEGFDNVTKLMIVDSNASALTAGAVTEYGLEQYPQIEEILYLSPYASLVSVKALSKFTKGKNRIIGSFGGTLNSDKILYFSPLPHNEPWRWADPKEVKVLEQLFGNVAKKICVGGDWSRNFFNPSKTREEFIKWWGEQGYTIKDLEENSNLQAIEKIFPNLDDITPYSTKRFINL